MGRVNRRIGKSSETANITADGTGGGVLDGFLHTYFNRSGNLFNAPSANTGLTATGGVVSDYVEGANVYRAHVFTSSGTFAVTSIGEFGPNIDYLVVAGGGGGGKEGGGGGAGGMRSSDPGMPAPPKVTLIPIPPPPPPVFAAPLPPLPSWVLD